MRIRRLSLGNPGDVNPIGEDLSEMRIDYGSSSGIAIKQGTKLHSIRTVETQGMQRMGLRIYGKCFVLSLKQREWNTIKLALGSSDPYYMALVVPKHAELSRLYGEHQRADTWHLSKKTKTYE